MPPQCLLDQLVHLLSCLLHNVAHDFDFLISLKPCMQLLLGFQQLFNSFDGSFVLIPRFHFDLRHRFLPLGYFHGTIELSSFLNYGLFFCDLFFPFLSFLSGHLRFELVKESLAGVFIETISFRFAFRIMLDDHCLFVILSQLVCHDLHLRHFIEDAFVTITSREVPQIVSLIMATVNDAPQVKTVRPDSYLAVFGDRDQTILVVVVDLGHASVVSHAFTND